MLKLKVKKSKLKMIESPKAIPEFYILIFTFWFWARHFSEVRTVVGERLQCSEGWPARATGALRSENVGMSNPKFGWKPDPRKFKVSAAMAIIRGLGGPKAMEKSAADGQLVNIPARRCITYGGTEEISNSALMVWRRWLKNCCTGKSVQLALMRNSE